MSDEPDSEPVSLEESPQDLDLPLPKPVDILSQLEAIRQATREAFQVDLNQAGGAVTWLSSRCPLSHTSLGTVMTDPGKMESVVVGETQAFWTGHEARLVECARCPKDGAACAETSERVRPGRVVKLLAIVESRVVESQLGCERYQEFRLARRLELVGVDKRLSRLKLQGLSAEPPPNVILAFDDFIASGEGKLAPSERQLLIEGEKARGYGVALLRSTVRNFPNASYRSVHVPTLIRSAMNAMTTKEESPLPELVDYDVLVLDAVDQESLKKDSWSRKEIGWIFERRRDQGRATIVTSIHAAKEAFPGVRVLKV